MHTLRCTALHPYAQVMRVELRVERSVKAPGIQLAWQEPSGTARDSTMGALHSRPACAPKSKYDT